MKYSILLVVFVLLCTVTGRAQNIETPADVAAPPQDATCTDSGLCSKVLAVGTGDAHPDAWDKVSVHYSGWTTDGQLFDSSLNRATA